MATWIPKALGSTRLAVAVLAVLLGGCAGGGNEDTSGAPGGAPSTPGGRGGAPGGAPGTGGALGGAGAVGAGGALGGSGATGDTTAGEAGADGGEAGQGTQAGAAGQGGATLDPGAARYLRADGHLLRAGGGDEVMLRGVNLGGWLVTENWMCGITDATDAASGRFTLETLEERFGEERAHQLMEIWRDRRAQR